MSFLRTCRFLLPFCAAGASANSMSLGPSLSWSDGPTVGIDATLMRMTGPLPLWATGGGSLRTGPSTGRAYLEAGTWALLPLGFGASLGSGSQEGMRAHAFVGVPIPLYGIADSRQPGIYLEPYYRPSFALAHSAGIRHEIGFLLKFTDLEVGSPPHPKAPVHPDAPR